MAKYQKVLCWRKGEGQTWLQEHPNQFSGAQKLAAHVHLPRDLLQTPDLHRNPPPAPWTRQQPAKATSSCPHRSFGCQGTRAPPPQAHARSPLRGGSEPSPPRPAGTSGSCPPIASLDLGRVKPPNPAVWPMAPISDTPWRPWVGSSFLPSASYLPQSVGLRLPREAHREALPGSEVERQGAFPRPVPPEKIAGDPGR